MNVNQTNINWLMLTVSFYKEVICLKNIIFDLGGVILIGKPIDVLDNLNIDKKTYNQLKIFFDDWDKIDLGEESLEYKYKQCNFSKEYDEFYKNKLINYYKWREVDMRLIKCIHQLKKNGYNVYILSDNNKECIEYYKNSSTFKDIDGWSLSCDYHTTKGEGHLFDVFINEFNLNPSECYFIDDELNNIEEAKKHGINGSIFTTSDDIDKLYDEMRNIGINI